MALTYQQLSNSKKQQQNATPTAFACDEDDDDGGESVRPDDHNRHQHHLHSATARAVVAASADKLQTPTFEQQQRPFEQKIVAENHVSSATAQQEMSPLGMSRRKGRHYHDLQFNTLCVVCGDRACNHHYYGVAACHGCKCFFWRTVKHQMQYVCRGKGNCEISSNQRSNCRFCRYKRCIEVGMKPEAVRMGKTVTPEKPDEFVQKQQQLSLNVSPAPKQRRLTPTGRAIKGGDDFGAEKSPADSTVESHFGIERYEPSEDKLDSILKNSESADLDRLVQRIAQIERQTNDVADFSENEAPQRQLFLEDLFYSPEQFDRFRTQVSFYVRLRRVNVEEMEFCKYRTLTKASDYIRTMADAIDFGELFATTNHKEEPQHDQGHFSLQDKIVLLRNGFASMTLFDIAAGTAMTTRDSNLLCLPTGITVSRNGQIVSNSFLNQKIVNECANTLVRKLVELDLDAEEFLLLKAIATLNNSDGTDLDNFGHLSRWAQWKINQLQDRLHAALYRHCKMHRKNAATKTTMSLSSASGGGRQTSSSPVSATLEQPALRFAKLLNVLPKITVLARDLIEHIRMIQTFDLHAAKSSSSFSSSSSAHGIVITDGIGVESIFFQLFGDIFQQRESSRTADQEQASLIAETRTGCDFFGGNANKQHDHGNNAKAESAMYAAAGPVPPPSAASDYGNLEFRSGTGPYSEVVYNERQPESWSRSTFHQL